MQSNETFFLTGFPGFIANRLVERLAQTNAQFILLVQPALLGRAKDEIAQIAATAGRSLADFRVVEGDITLSNSVYHRRTRSCFVPKRPESSILQQSTI
jgi:hypothetical protein